MDGLAELLIEWKQKPDFCKNISSWNVIPAIEAQTRPFPQPLRQELQTGLTKLSVSTLYSHQIDCFEAIERGQNVVISTGTASGKTLAYNLPILNRILNQANPTALYLFPTKALTQDQLTSINKLISCANISSLVKPEIFDGDTPQSKRIAIRNQANVVMTNPDMLHQAILPHHTLWYKFLTNLAFVVIDEMHSYRGVFGSHFANVLRRLKRVCTFYGSFPQFVLTSATIGNPLELSEKLTETKTHLINSDGSQHGEKQLIIYNPPIIDKQLAIRKSAVITAVEFTRELINHNLQTLVFARTRRTVEMFLSHLRASLPAEKHKYVRAYRSGYLKSERREIEKEFREGRLKAVVATSALELGIDIGELETVILLGYPGSIATTKQRSGRAGRKNQSSATILIPTPDPLDQYLASHPEYFIDQNPENALIDPNNLAILTQHVLCAAFELPFTSNESFGNFDQNILHNILELYLNQSVFNKQGDKYFYLNDQYPAAKVSLRSTTPDIIALKVGNEQDNQLLGEVDSASAAWLVHPGAIYLHDAGFFKVNSLDFEIGECLLERTNNEYYTIPNLSTTIERFSSICDEKYNFYHKQYGQLSLKFVINSFKKYRWLTNELLNTEALNLPSSELETTGFWINISQNLIDKLKSEGTWTAQTNDYGNDWSELRKKILLRDGYKCRACGKTLATTQLHVHHILPIKSFADASLANTASNLVSLCPACHSLAELNVRFRSGLAAAGNALRNLAPLFVMCEREDIGSLSEVKSVLADGLPSILVYDNIPGGLGLSRKLYENHHKWIASAIEAIAYCPCEEGCPACVGPVGEQGYGGKNEGIALLRGLL